MNTGRALPGSFRDPSGRVYELDGRILRTVADYFAVDFDFVESTGLFQKLIADSRLLPFQKVNIALLTTTSNNFKYLLEVPPLRLVSYPYEWSFPALKAAARLHLVKARIANTATVSSSGRFLIRRRNHENTRVTK